MIARPFLPEKLNRKSALVAFILAAATLTLGSGIPVRHGRAAGTARSRLQIPRQAPGRGSA